MKSAAYYCEPYRNYILNISLSSNLWLIGLSDSVTFILNIINYFSNPIQRNSEGTVQYFGSRLESDCQLLFILIYKPKRGLNLESWNPPGVS